MKTIIAKQLRKPSGFLGFSGIRRAFEIGYGPGAGVDFSRTMHKAATK